MALVVCKFNKEMNDLGFLCHLVQWHIFTLSKINANKSTNRNVKTYLKLQQTIEGLRERTKYVSQL